MAYHLRTVLFLLLCMASLYACARPKASSDYLGIAFYNLENLFDPADDPDKFDEDFTPDGRNKYTEQVYRKKLHNMAFAIGQMTSHKMPQGPVLIGVAEVENLKVLNDLVSEPELKVRQYRIVHFDAPDSRGIDVGLLYQAKHFTVISARALPVPITDGTKKERTRDVLYVMGKLGKDTLHILVNHWPSRREGEDNSAWKRMSAARVNKTLMDKIRTTQPKAKIVVMGDLNDDPGDASVTEGLMAQGDIDKVSASGMFNPWLSIHQKGQGTLVYNNKWNLFDQILVSGGLIGQKENGWKYHSAEIFKPKFLQYPFGKKQGYPHRSFSGNRWTDGYSDHFPTIVYLIHP